ncbi:MAG: hypothetical protein U9Q67_00870, partial [Patescibacteria group bacterium]|nr:hypothetical protein [Patescibacteria group bacterium]
TTPSTGPATPSVTCTDGCIVGGSCVSLGGSKTVGGTVYNCGHSGNIWKSCAPGYTALGDDPSAGCHRSSVSTSTSAPGSCSASDVPGCTNAAGQVKCTNGSFSANCLECPDGTWQVSTCFHNQVSTSQVRVQRTNHACSRVTGVSTSMTSVSINNGKDCKNAATGKWGKCSNGSCVVTSSALPMKGVSDSSSETVLGLRRYINEVRAESIMLSPSSGLYSFSENGVYCMDYDGSNYCFEILSPDNNLLYIDVDGDGSYTAGVDINIADDVVQIEVSLDRKKRMVSLSSGFNFISMDLVDISVGSHDFTGTAVGDTASTFLSRLNSTYGDLFYSIARFDSGWKVIGSRDGVLYGEVNDFQLIPGKGYLVKVKNDIVVEIYGREVIDPVPTFFNEGWNLVGIHGSTVDYTAESLIDAIDTVASLDADNVTKWEVDLSKYEGLQKEPDESGTQQVYGFDFPITDRMSYFVSIAEGSGTWTPD